jgi:hypothetical protein
MRGKRKAQLFLEHIPKLILARKKSLDKGISGYALKSTQEPSLFWPQRLLPIGSRSCKRPFALAKGLLLRNSKKKKKNK